MEKIAVSTLHENTDEIVARAEAGEVITIVVDGRPVVQIGPRVANSIDSLVDAGLVTPATRSIRDWIIPDGPVSTRLSDELRRDRDEDRF